MWDIQIILINLLLNIKIFKTDKELYFMLLNSFITQILSTLKNYLSALIIILKIQTGERLKELMLTNSNIGLIGFRKILKQIQLFSNDF